MRVIYSHVSPSIKHGFVSAQAAYPQRFMIDLALEHKHCRGDLQLLSRAFATLFMPVLSVEQVSICLKWQLTSEAHQR